VYSRRDDRLIDGWAQVAQGNPAKPDQVSNQRKTSQHSDVPPRTIGGSSRASGIERGYAITRDDYSYPSPQTIPGDKVCFSAKFRIYVGDQVYASYYANTIVSKTNYSVVTAFLSNNSQASACRQEG
jgi:hypothetical protein